MLLINGVNLSYVATTPSRGNLVRSRTMRRESSIYFSPFFYDEVPFLLKIAQMRSQGGRTDSQEIPGVKDSGIPANPIIGREER